MNNIKMTSLGELSKDRKLNMSKSLLTYYAYMGLLTPMAVVGKMGIFSEEEVRERLKLIERYKSQGLTLKKIKEIFDNEQQTTN